MEIETKIEFDNGDEYCGKTIDGIPNGYGFMKYDKTGNIYEGNWKDGKKEGSGKFANLNGDIYEGSWKNNKPYGYGITKTSTYTYEGNWKDSKKEGIGKIVFSDGRIYDGEWFGNKYNGRGKFFYSNGDIYEGEFVDNKIEGFGKMTYLNGNIYIGTWHNNKPKKGKITFVDGTEKKFENKMIQNEFSNIIKKPDELKSPNIKNQIIGDCWAHSVSRNFVRTLQILNVIKSKYTEQLYDLFYTILTENRDCDSGYSSESMFYLLDYLKNNYHENIFNVKYGKSKCNFHYCEIEKLDKNILIDMDPNDKKKFIDDLEYLFSDNLLFIGKYIYTVESNNFNKPSNAIKIMLNYKLQPFTSILINNYFSDIRYTPSNIFPSIPTISNFDNTCISDKNINSGLAGHAVNLRKWINGGIEFKNSWGLFSANEGNFSVSDLKYVVCKDKDKDKDKDKSNDEYNKNIEFTSLIFDYDNFTNEYKIKINNQLCKYWNTFDNSLDTKESTYYIGSYNKYGLFEGYGEMTYSNGDIYKGSWINGFMNGDGKMIYFDGNIYEGSWINDRQNGYGLCVFADGAKYEGDWKDGIIEGIGKYIFSNGDIYEGSWKNGESNGYGITKTSTYTYEGNWKDGKKQGIGKIVHSNGEKYEGDWIENEYNGHGKFISEDGAKYEGDWKDGIIEGIGKYIFSNGDIYEGSWKNNEPNGYGITKTSTYTYEGNWKDRKKHGIGKIVYSDGEIYEGEFVDNEIKGNGKYIFLNGDIYNGMWKNNSPNGYGVSKTSEFTYEGNWKDGSKQGIGKIVFSDGRIYDGEWFNNEFNGRGKFISSNGEIYEGEWKNGKLIQLINNNGNNDYSNYKKKYIKYKLKYLNLKKK